MPKRKRRRRTMACTVRVPRARLRELCAFERAARVLLDEIRAILDSLKGE